MNDTLRLVRSQLEPADRGHARRGSEPLGRAPRSRSPRAKEACRESDDDDDDDDDDDEDDEKDDKKPKGRKERSVEEAVRTRSAAEIGTETLAKEWGPAWPASSAWAARTCPPRS